MSRDIFRPHFDPARSIYDAFQREATKRKGRTPAEWQTAELQSVLAAANEWASRMGCVPLTMRQVAIAESTAVGHADYGAKWAYRVCDLL